MRRISSANFMAYEFKITRRVEFAETDMAGIVHFSNYFRMMEFAEHAFFRSLGSSIHAHDGERVVGWPRASVSCDYLRPLRFEDEVEIQLLVAEVRSRSIRYVFVFRKVSDGLEVARGRMVAVCATIKDGQLVSVTIPEGLREQLSAAPGELVE